MTTGNNKQRMLPDSLNPLMHNVPEWSAHFKTLQQMLEDF